MIEPFHHEASGDDGSWRTRAFAPKVRTGCATCKARRVKCDEQKPECARCIKAKRRCPGYPGDVKHDTTSSSDGRSALIKLANRNAGRGINPLTSVMSMDDVRSYQYYKERAQVEVSGYFKSEFWEKLIFQASQTDHAVRNAILAVGSSHELLHDGPRSLQKFAVTKYSIAAKEVMTTKYKDDSIQTILICCMIFICFELWQNNFWMAIKHCENGLALLKETKHESLIDPSIIQIFVLFDLQLSSMVPDRVPALCDCSFIKKLDPTVIELFKSENEARASFDCIRMGIIKFVKLDAKPYQRHNKLNVPADLLTQQRNFLNQLKLWGVAFDTFFQTATSKEDQASPAIYILAIWHRMYTVLVGTYFSTYDEFDYFDYAAHFEDIVTLAKHVREIPHVDRLIVSQTSLACDMNIMQPLFVTAIKCRIPKTRQVAIDIMRSIPEREGTWFSQEVADLALQMIKAEEEGVVGFVPDGSALLPLCARVVETTMQDFALNESDAVGQGKRVLGIMMVCALCRIEGNQVRDDEYMNQMEPTNEGLKYVCGHTWN